MTEPDPTAPPRACPTPCARPAPNTPGSPPRSPRTTSPITGTMPRRSRMPTTTPCAGASSRSRSLSGPRHPDRARRHGRGQAVRQVQVDPPPPCRCSRSATSSPTRMSRNSARACARFLGLPPDAPLAITAEPKIDGLSCSPALRGRPPRPGGDAGRRLRRGGRHRQRPHPGSHPERAPRRGRAGRAGGARRGLHDQAGLRRPQRPAGRGRAPALRQPAQRRGRLAAPARPRRHGGAAPAVLRLCLGRAFRAAGRDPERHDRGLRALRPADEPADGALPIGR